jgi:type II secretory pathway predicted ATPase ExeA
MTLREAIQDTRLGYRAFAHALGSSAATVSRLVNYGEYPTRMGVDEARKRCSKVLLGAGVDPRSVVWPDPGVRPGSSGYWREHAGQTVKVHHKALRCVDNNKTEEIDLMQLDREVLRLFGLRSNPFINDVEADEDVFRYKGLEAVETAIRDAIEERGFLAICGPSGSGKTTIWDGIEADYGRRDDTVICRPLVMCRETLTPEHLARSLIYGLLGENTPVRLNAEDRGRQLSQALRAGANRKAVLLIDDAHFCSTSVLRQLKTFYEEKIGRYRLLAIILIGLEELKPKLATFAEIGNRIRLVEAPKAPVEEYLRFKLRRAGSEAGKIFDAGGWAAFVERFKEPRRAAVGRPLLINAACIRCMVALHQNGGQPGELVTKEIVDSLPGAEERRRA